MSWIKSLTHDHPEFIKVSHVFSFWKLHFGIAYHRDIVNMRGDLRIIKIKLLKLEYAHGSCESRSVVSDTLRHHGILQAGILQCVAFPFSRGSSQPRDWIQVSHIAGISGGFFTSWATREAPVNYVGGEGVVVKIQTLGCNKSRRLGKGCSPFHWALWVSGLGLLRTPSFSA